MIVGAASMFFRELSVVESVRRIASLGYGSVEVWMEHLAESGSSAKAVRAAAREEGVLLTVHAFSYDLNIAGANDGIRRESLSQIRTSIETARELDARVVVIHPGRLSSSKEEPTRYWGALTEAVQAILEWAAESGPSVTLEAMESREREVFTDPSALRRLFDDPAASGLGLTLDIAHMYTIMNPEAFLDGVAPRRIKHVHLSDGKPGRTHVPLGNGSIDLPRVMAKLRSIYDGIVSVEAYVPEKGSETLTANRNYLKRLGLME